MVLSYSHGSSSLSSSLQEEAGARQDRLTPRTLSTRSLCYVLCICRVAASSRRHVLASAQPYAVSFQCTTVYSSCVSSQPALLPSANVSLLLAPSSRRPLVAGTLYTAVCFSRTHLGE